MTDYSINYDRDPGANNNSLYIIIIIPIVIIFTLHRLEWTQFPSATAVDLANKLLQCL